MNPTEESVSQVNKIFTNMTWNEKTDVSWAQSWLKKNFPHSAYLENPIVVETLDTGKTSEWTEFDHKQRMNILRGCLDHFKSCRKMMIEILNLLKLTFKDACFVVDRFIEYFEHCSKTFESKTYIKAKDRVFIPKQVELQFLTQPLLFSLYHGFNVEIETWVASPFVPFLVNLVKSFEDAGLPSSTITISYQPEEDSPKKNLDDWFCPMVISSDADFTSAIECLKNVLCSFQGKTPYSPTHLYVQEIIYHDVHRYLNDKLERIKHGSRFDKFTEIEDVNENINVPETNDLPGFEPFPGSPFRVYSGWNPIEMNSLVPKPISGSIILVSYRSNDELVTLLKKCPPPTAISIWSEKLSTTQKISSYCRSPVVWINSCGLLDEKIFDSSSSISQSTVKMSLHCAVSESSSTISSELEQASGDCSFKVGTDMDSCASDTSTAVKLAKKTFLNSQKLTIEHRLSIILEIIKKEMKRQPAVPIINLAEIEDLQHPVPHQEKTGRWTEVEGMKVIRERIPVGILVVELLPDFNESRFRLVIRLIEVALMYGNSVILVTAKEYSHLGLAHRMFANTELGCVVVVRSDGFDVLQLVRRVQPVARLIRLGASPLLLDHQTFHVPLDDDLFSNMGFLYHLTTYIQCKWVPSL